MFSGHSQISEQLCFVNRQDALDGLHLDNNQITYQKIEPQKIFEKLPLVLNWYLNLPRNPDFPFVKFHYQSLFVKRLQKSRPEDSMNFYRCADYFPGELVVHHSVASAFSVPLRWV